MVSYRYDDLQERLYGRIETSIHFQATTRRMDFMRTGRNRTARRWVSGPCSRTWKDIPEGRCEAILSSIPISITVSGLNVRTAKERTVLK
jgi:hypothetical protein